MRSRNRIAGTAFLMALPIAVWGLIGDLSTTEHDPDFLVEPILDLPRWLEVGIGAAAIAVLIVAAAALRSARQDASRDAKTAFALVVAAGLVGAFGWRVVTAGVIGANIGGGLVLFWVFPAVAGLLLAAALLAMRAKTSRGEAAAVEHA